MSAEVFVVLWVWVFCNEKILLVTCLNNCYPEAGLDAVKAILDYRAAHQFQAQP